MTEYDEYGTPLDRETFMKELENFYRQRSLEFKPPMFYGETLNYLKLWRAVIRLGCYDVVFQAIGAVRGFLRPYFLLYLFTYPWIEGSPTTFKSHSGRLGHLCINLVFILLILTIWHLVVLIHLLHSRHNLIRRREKATW